MEDYEAHVERLQAAMIEGEESDTPNPSTRNVERADAYIAAMSGAFEALASGQQKSRSIDEVRPGHRKLNVGFRFIVHRLTNDTIRIVRVLHQRRDIASRLQD